MYFTQKASAAMENTESALHLHFVCQKYEASALLISNYIGQIDDESN